MQVLRNTYSNNINFYAGTPENFVAPTEAPTQAPTEAATEAATEVATEQTEPATVMTEPPAVTEATEEITEPVTVQPEKPQEKPGLLDYWPVAVAAVFFFGGSALTVWALLIRPTKRAKRGSRSRRR